MISLETTPEPGEAYYREHGWSGCAGSNWHTLTEATKDGWRHAARLATQQTADLTAAEASAFTLAIHCAMVDDDFRTRRPDQPIHAAYLAPSSDQRVKAERIADLLAPMLTALRDGTLVETAHARLHELLDPTAPETSKD